MCQIPIVLVLPRVAGDLGCDQIGAAGGYDTISLLPYPATGPARRLTTSNRERRESRQAMRARLFENAKIRPSRNNDQNYFQQKTRS
jgi:hypothetical protein